MNTNKTDNNLPNEKKPKLPPKAKGPFRWEAIIPAFILVLLVTLYMIFFFDQHLKRVIEIGGTHANGAEVNIDNLQLSFTELSLKIDRIQVTNKEKPTHNLVEIGKIHFNLLGDAILRAKMVVETAEILQIQIDSKRRSPGEVLPKKQNEGPGLASQAKEAALDEIKSRYNDNVLGDIAELLDGGDAKTQLNNLKAQLKSVVRVEELQKMVKEKEIAWKEKIAQLPKTEELKNVEARIKAVKLDGFKSLDEVQSSVKELESIYKDVDSKVKNVKTAAKDFNSDLSSITGQVKDLENMVKNDIKDLQKHFKIPSLDAKSLAESLFGKLILTKLQGLLYWVDRAQEYMPPKKTPEQLAEEKRAAITPRERELGKDYKFGRPNSYPLFWLKRAEISSRAKPDSFIGDVDGKVFDVTNDPPQIGKPLKMQLTGSFPQQKIMGVSAELALDHTTLTPSQELKLSASSFPVQGQMLSKSDKATFGFENAQGSANLSLFLKNKIIDFKTKTELTKIAYVTDANNSYVKDILKGIAQDITMVDLNTSVTGPLSNLSIAMNSNLGAALQAAFQRQLELQIAKAKEQLREFVEGKIAEQRARLNGELEKFEKQLGFSLRDKEAAVKGIEAKIEEAKKQAEENGKKSLKQGVEKELNKLLKGKFKF